MNAVINYSLEVVVASLILGGFYYLFFKNMTFFRFNRFYLLSAMLLPLMFPWIDIPVTSSTALPNISILLDEVVVGAQVGVSIEQVPSFSGLQWFYLIITSLILLRIAIGIISILVLFKKAKRQQRKDLLLYVSPNNVNPFSVFKRIVVSNATFQDKNALNRILIHEQAHINQHHGIDVFLAEVICALFWFNPMVWLLKKELKSTHEYLADEKVLEQDFDLAEYFMLLFNNTVGRNVVLANNFNQSLNLKRMKMMKKKRSSRFARMMSIMAMPVILGATIMLTSQCTSRENDLEVEKETVDQKSATLNVEDHVFTVVQQMPQFIGGDSALMNYLTSNVEYPAVAKENGIQGRVYVEFTVDKDGAIIDVKILKGVAPVLDAEAIRVVKQMPNWEPGMQKGKKVRVSYKLPINFTLR